MSGSKHSLGPAVDQQACDPKAHDMTDSQANDKEAIEPQDEHSNLSVVDGMLEPRCDASNGEGEADDTNSEDDDQSQGGEAEETEDAEHDDASRASDDSWEDEPRPLDLNYEALKHIATYFLPGSHGACIGITTIRRGAFHEIRVLHFEDGWTCIGRFTREKEMLNKTESELATIDYLLKHTSIPVPKTLFVNYNENHVVGAAFVLMERLEGVKLSELWDKLSLQHRLYVIGQLGDVVGQLADLRFDQIGSLTGGGSVGPLLNISREVFDVLEGPFATTSDYFCAALNENRRYRPKEALAFYPAIKEELRTFLDNEASNPTLHAPYRLIHDDLNFWNILVTQEGAEQPPKITGVIDWDYAYTGPLHYLCDYPPAVLDMNTPEEQADDSKLLRQHFVKTVAHRFPKGSADRENVKRCFREKSWLLTGFQLRFAGWELTPELVETACVNGYLISIRGDDEDDFNHPYGACEDYEVDSDPESDDE